MKVPWSSMSFANLSETEQHTLAHSPNGIFSLSLAMLRGFAE